MTDTPEAREDLIRTLTASKNEAERAYRQAQQTWTQTLADLYHEGVLTPAQIYRAASIHKNTLVTIRNANPADAHPAHRIKVLLQEQAAATTEPVPSLPLFQDVTA